MKEIQKRMLSCNWLRSYAIFSVCFILPTFICTANNHSIYLHGTGENTTLENVQVFASNLYWWNTNPPKQLSKSKKEPNGFHLRFEVAEPQFVNFSIIGETWQIFVTPGDSLEFTFIPKEKSYTIVFDGINKGHYNYSPQRQLLFRPYIDDPRFNADIILYKKSVEDRYQQEVEFLNKFRNENNTGETFYYQALSDLNFEKYKFLYTPIKGQKVKQGEIPFNYFSNEISLSEWNNERFLGMHQFDVALVTKFIYCYTENPWSNFDIILKNIKTSFSGKIKDYLITSIVDIYAKRQSTEYQNQLLTLIEEAKGTLKDSVFIKQVFNARDTYLLLNKTLPDSILSKTYLKDFESKSQITLAELLKRNANKGIYVDFWASWCAACRVDISDSKQTKEYLKKRDVNLIYISLDKNSDEEKWRRASVKDQITNHQYLLVDNFSSPLAKYLSINALPRYILMNSDHLVKNTDAPRSNYSNLEKLKSDISQMQAITFK